jgi:aquaporin Z
MVDALRRGWPHLLIEAGGAALVLFAACVYATLLYHPSSPVTGALPSPAAKRVVMGLAMGATVAAITYSRLGRRSGAHLNPAVTLAFLRLGRVPPADAAGYVVAQVAGAMAGIGIASLVLGGLLAHPEVHYVTTRPGPRGPLVAATAELAISTTLMVVVLTAVGARRLMRYAGLLSASLVTLFIAVESPVSGASMNPARSFGSALGAGEWNTLWVYLVGPTLGMLVAAELHRRRARAPGEGQIGSPIGCAKLAHDDQPCHFCAYRWRRSAESAALTHPPAAGTRPPSARHEPGTIPDPVSL